MPAKRKHRLVGVHEVKRRLSSGEVVIYRYAWRGGPRIHAEDPGSHEYLVEYTKLTRDHEDAKREGTLAGLVYVYRQSAAFHKLGDATKRSYDAAIDEIEAEFCDLPVEVIDKRGTRSLFLEWRDGFADTPRKADMLITVLARILSVARDRELIDRNPLERVEKLSAGTRRDQIWSDDQLKAFKAHAGTKLSLALELARWTGQRQGDLLRLPWSAYDGSHITLRQSKTGRTVRVRVSSDLKALLDGTKREAVTILTTERGKRSWTSDGFRASWAKTCVKAGIEGVTFHDLRGTFVTLAYRNGASIKEIAEVSGHSERDAEAIIRRHYLAGDSAVTKLEAGNRKARGSVKD
ncbi:integrase [Devosia pacifica]|uniref:Integrase n=1 Tax=Devosia pacifica TaxID=1335967 RepID=A0A918RZP2_9HYPH|nr:tyrosine-type recombinase/integrase [Devosia pacifica]GHA15533.1 integrase [Devosia pacifica]